MASDSIFGRCIKVEYFWDEVEKYLKEYWQNNKEGDPKEKYELLSLRVLLKCSQGKNYLEVKCFDKNSEQDHEKVDAEIKKSDGSCLKVQIAMALEDGEQEFRKLKLISSGSRPCDGKILTKKEIQKEFNEKDLHKIKESLQFKDEYTEHEDSQRKKYYEKYPQADANSENKIEVTYQKIKEIIEKKLRDEAPYNILLVGINFMDDNIFQKLEKRLTKIFLKKENIEIYIVGINKWSDGKHFFCSLN